MVLFAGDLRKAIKYISVINRVVAISHIALESPFEQLNLNHVSEP